MTRYIVMERSAKMPSSCWGRYGKLAVVETSFTEGEPSMISLHAKGMVRIVNLRDKLHKGRGGDRTAYAIAKRELEAEAMRLNAEARLSS